MKTREATPILDDFLTTIVAEFGFTRTASLIYTRPWNEAMAQIGFSSRRDARGFVAFGCGVGVYFDSLSKWLNDDMGGAEPRLATPIHFLHQDRKFTEWTFTGPEDLERLRASIVADLTTHAVPFFEKYSRLKDAVTAVASPNPRDWFNWNVNTRVVFLAAARLGRGDKVGAIKILDDALVDRKNASPKARFEIEDMRRRLAESS